LSDTGRQQASVHAAPLSLFGVKHFRTHISGVVFGRLRANFHAHQFAFQPTFDQLKGFVVLRRIFGHLNADQSHRPDAFNL
jgi:hypothetical protein